MRAFVLICLAGLFFALANAEKSPNKRQGKTPIEHFIVLMMENRSFDHLLGWLKETVPEVQGLDGTEFNCLVPDDPSSGCAYVSKDAPQFSPGDPPHDFDSQVLQIYGYAKPINETAAEVMNGFMLAAQTEGINATTPMRMFTAANDSAPIINLLAQEFALFDAWHCAGPLPTDPNRAFAMSGTSNGMVDNFNGTLWSQQSYFNLLTTNNITWQAFYDSELWAIGYFEDMRVPPNSNNIHEIDVFFEQMSKNELAQFTWLQPSMLASKGRLPNWQHPDASLREGERLIKRVYEALRNSDLWETTALIITYDEHGGFYDSVRPPTKDIPSPDGVVATNGYTFESLGIRIPTVVVSPWVNKGTIVHEAEHGPQKTSRYEGTSSIATANRIFGIDEYLTARHSWAATFDWLFEQRSTPRTDAPTSLPYLAPTLPEEIPLQRAKKLSDHLAIQVKFYCHENQVRECPDVTQINQGEASDFILEQVPIFLAKLHA